VALEGGFGAWEDVGWCGWVLGGLRWPLEAFSTLGLQKKSYKKNHRRTQENYKRKIGKLQEAYRRRPREILASLRA